jgi:hypothetical protein
MKKHLYFLLIKKRNIILLKLNMLFILVLIGLLLVEDLILQFMINLQLQIQLIVISHIHIQEEK